MMAKLIQLIDDVSATQFEIHESGFKIGRSTTCEIYIDDPAVSSEHCVIDILPPEEGEELPSYRIRDLESTNGTFVNGEKITEKPLYHEDLIRVGVKTFKFIFIAPTEKGFQKTVKIKKSWIPGLYYTKKED